VIGLMLAAAILGPACASAPAFSSTPSGSAAVAAQATPSVSVYAGSDGTVAIGDDLAVTVVVSNPGDAALATGTVSVAVSSRPLATVAALTAFQKSPHTVAQRSLGSAATTSVASGGTTAVATVTVPAASVGLSASHPGVYGLTATVTTPDGTLPIGTGTLVVAGTHPATVGVAAVMPLTVPPRADGLIPAQELATYTAPGGLLTKELDVASGNAGLTLGIDPMILTSIRVLGTSAPASAASWLSTLEHLPNHTFPLQYGDADPSLQTQAGLAKPLQPTDFTYAMSPADHTTPLQVGETSQPTSTPTTDTATPSPTPTTGTPLPSVADLTAWPYDLGGIAWPSAGAVKASDLEAFSRSGLTTTIVSGSNTTASTLTATPDAVLPVSGGTALVTDDAVGAAMDAVATAGSALDGAVANAALNAQLALAAENAQNGGVIVVSTGRIWPTDASLTTSAIAEVLGSRFVHESTLRLALTAPPTPGLKLVDKTNPAARLSGVGRLLDLAGEPRTGGVSDGDSIAAFSSALQTPALLTGDVRARLLGLMSAGWAGSPDWSTAVTKQLDSMASTLSAVQISAPESIRQASHQALIPITVTNELSYPVDIVLRATPSSARLDVTSDTEKTLAARSSVKILIDVKAQLSNGTVWLGLQLFSPTGVRIGDPTGASIDVHADWEGIGALILGILVVGFFGFGLVRTAQRRRREKAARDASGASDDGSTPAADQDASPTPPGDEEPRGQ